MKKELNFEAMGVREMTRSEMIETEGGIIWFLVAAVAVLICESCDFQFTAKEVEIKACAGCGCESDTTAVSPKN